jgi:hypothetical protein
VKRIGRTVGKAITVYENDTLNSLMTRIREVFGQNDFTSLLTKNLGEITSIEQIFYLCQMNVDSVIFRVATSSEVADQ